MPGQKHGPVQALELIGRHPGIQGGVQVAVTVQDGQVLDRELRLDNGPGHGGGPVPTHSTPDPGYSLRHARPSSRAGHLRQSRTGLRHSGVGPGPPQRGDPRGGGRHRRHGGGRGRRPPRRRREERGRPRRRPGLRGGGPALPRRAPALRQPHPAEPRAGLERGGVGRRPGRGQRAAGRAARSRRAGDRGGQGRGPSGQRGRRGVRRAHRVLRRWPARHRGEPAGAARDRVGRAAARDRELHAGGPGGAPGLGAAGRCDLQRPAGEPATGRARRRPPGSARPRHAGPAPPALPPAALPVDGGGGRRGAAGGRARLRPERRGPVHARGGARRVRRGNDCPRLDSHSGQAVRSVQGVLVIKSDRWIRRMAGEKGMIKPFEDRQVRKGGISYGLSSYGYDIRIADEFKIFTNINTTIVDPKSFDPRSFVDYQGEVAVIPPNSFALARSVEYFKIPRNVLTICVGKSTYARCGIITNVTPFEPEWEGYVTLEISNTTPLPAKIYANEGIAQVLFFESDEACETSYADRQGKYQGQQGIVLPTV